jgi:C4-dicarboxylate transporter DctM subunit
MLFAAADLSRDPFVRVVSAVLPFLMASVFALALITYIPAITMTLPGILGLL